MNAARVILGAIVIVAAVAGVFLWYTAERAFYTEVSFQPGAEIRLIEGDGTRTAYLQRCRFLSNFNGRSQLHVSASGGSRFDAWDSLVADGRGGVDIIVNQSQAHLTNLTVADNELQGIRGSVAGGNLTVYNTIAFGNAGGNNFQGSVLPYILRGVRLLGVNVNNPVERMKFLWNRLATDLRPRHLDRIARRIRYDELETAFDELLAARVRGRQVVDFSLG